jgi:hypothetical protein
MVLKDGQPVGLWQMYAPITAEAWANALIDGHEIVAHLNEAGVTHVKKHSELYIVEFCDDCGAPLFADPSGELVHPEMPEDAPQGGEHFH